MATADAALAGLPPEWEGVLCRADWVYLRQRLGGNRTRELRAVLVEVAPASRTQFVGHLRMVPDDTPGGSALLLAFGRFCDTAADLGCASPESAPW